MDYPIVFMQPESWPAVREIYCEGIAAGDAASTSLRAGSGGTARGGCRHMSSYFAGIQ